VPRSSALSSSLVSPTRFFFSPPAAPQADEDTGALVASRFPLPARIGESSPSFTPAADAEGEDEDDEKSGDEARGRD
jgi:hypothetical protein